MSPARLWHIPASHYNEKVRWALELKGIEHERRAPVMPAHIAAALWLTRGRSRTLPLLELDRRAIADSTKIIAALEHRYPDPPLYPADPEQRRRALALEEHFDEQLGPYTRLLALHELRREPEAIRDFAATMLPGPLARSEVIRRLAGAGAGAYVHARYRVGDEEGAEHARAKIVAAFDRLEAELAGGGGSYLVGDSFSVADLTAACMFGPVVLPPEGPKLPEPVPAFERFRAGLRERPGFRWVAGTFARHRGAARRP